MTNPSRLLMIGVVLQASLPVLAANPLVVLPQGNFACSVEVEAHEAPKPDPAFPERRYAPVMRKLVVTKVGNIRRDVGTWSDGSSSELWWVVDKQISVMQRSPFGKEALALFGELRDRACPKLLHFDADSVAWIKEGTKTSPKPDKGGLLHFQAEVTIQEAVGDTPAEIAVYQAWIDAKTLMPVRFDDGNARYTLKFSTAPPSTPLVMPPSIQAEVDLWQKESTPRPHR